MKASLPNIRISPKKLNVIAETVRGFTTKEAEKILTFMPKKGAKIMKKLISSAVANATNNFRQNAEDLVIKEIKVSKAFTLKRIIPGSRGRTKPILKRSSHLHIILEAKPKTAPVAKPTDKKATAKTKSVKTKK